MTRARGFTLIELAIVLVIVTILIGGLAMPLSAQIQARRIAETNKTLEEAHNALTGYAMLTAKLIPIGHPYLPCPDITGDGREDRDTVTGECSGSIGGVVTPISYGWFPWVTLGVAPQDAWGNRLRYVVISQFAKPGTGFSGTPPPGTLITICTTHACPALSSKAASVAFALISHGPNGWGAQNMNNAPGISQAAPTGPDETQNLASNPADPILVTRAPTKADDALGEFDDLVAWTSLTELIGRVCLRALDCQ
ncbi:MAG: hypothetical protein BGP20_13615 [Thiobacillus sp. 63-78]|uniref:type II secretion system protein n=1 Tax=Thiobacillus sp. 63-78 TaxID=1895859 RepID=UPI0009683637|nr:type II secretion system protein [Thiobacillus sp. 63-78]OJZ11743.1 MAG: hypothetical protein BGP20_13615 [Thiobacillus sp. 63-78]